LKGVIIAGGPGTRLRPLTYVRPKPIVPVVNRPFLEYQVELLKRHGISEIIFCTNYMAEMIQAHFGDGSRFGVKMHYAIEEAPLGTAGAIKNAEPLFRGDSILVFNGDVLTDFDLSAIAEFHRSSGAAVTLTLHAVPSPSPYGVIVTDEEMRVKEFREPSEEVKKMLARNPNVERTGTDHINAGIYVIESEVFQSVPKDVPVSIERQTFPDVLARGEKVCGYLGSGYWLDIGRPEQYLEAHRAILSGDVTAAVAGSRNGSGYYAGEDVDVDPSAHIDPTVHLGSRTRVAANARIVGTTSIGDDCVIEEGAVIEDCVILDDVTIGTGASLRRAIIDTHTTVEDNVTMQAATVVASNSRIGFGTSIT
jgi:NDP-sugar pyrophosphorylase family protein